MDLVQDGCRGNEVVGGTELDAARGIQAFELPSSELDIQAADVVVQLLDISCPDDGYHGSCLAYQPGERDLCRRAVNVRGDRLHCIRYREPGRGHLIAGRAASRPLLPASPVYLPVSSPPASGDQGVIVMPRARAIGGSSRSASRRTRLYSGCSPENRVQPRSVATALA